jgi:two-component system, chemotaxis family, chemotaxis protein CheY
MERTITVLVVDDDRFVRTSVRGSLLQEPDLAVVEASDGDEALAAVAASRPAVVLLDLLMPRRSGLEVLSQLRRASPESRIVVMTSLQTESLERLARSSGAVGFLAKPFHPLELIAAVRQALEG